MSQPKEAKQTASNRYQSKSHRHTNRQTNKQMIEHTNKLPTNNQTHERTDKTKQTKPIKQTTNQPTKQTNQTNQTDQTSQSHILGARPSAEQATPTWCEVDCLLVGFNCLFWFGLVWLGLAWFGLVWAGLGWFGLSDCLFD